MNFLRLSYTEGSTVGPRYKFVGDGPIDGVRCVAPGRRSRREFDDPCPDGWNQAQGDGERPGQGREPAKDGFDSAAKSDSAPKRATISRRDDSCTIERQVVRQDRPKFLRSGAGLPGSETRCACRPALQP